MVSNLQIDLSFHDLDDESLAHNLKVFQKEEEEDEDEEEVAYDRDPSLHNVGSFSQKSVAFFQTVVSPPPGRFKSGEAIAVQQPPEGGRTGGGQAVCQRQRAGARFNKKEDYKE